jgi:hypothetical protein
MNWLERKILMKFLQDAIQKYFLDFLAKYPLASHVAFLIIAGAMDIYFQSSVAQADVALLVAYITLHIPAGKFIVAVLSFAITWYYKHGK